MNEVQLKYSDWWTLESGRHLALLTKLGKWADNQTPEQRRNGNVRKRMTKLLGDAAESWVAKSIPQWELTKNPDIYGIDLLTSKLQRGVEVKFRGGPFLTDDDSVFFELTDQNGWESMTHKLGPDILAFVSGDGRILVVKYSQALNEIGGKVRGRRNLTTRHGTVGHIGRVGDLVNEGVARWVEVRPTEGVRTHG